MTGDAVRQARQRAPQTKELIYAVSERLQWNVNAYGKAWTGEDEDTEFIVAPLADAVETLTRERDEARKALTAFSAASLVVCPLCEAVDVSEAEISTCGESECPLRVYRAALAAVEAGTETPACDALDRAVLLANEVSPVLAAEIAALGSESTACPGDA